ncbi:MAG TPA: YdeI/OmpD-associated family protein [Pyrinomonadaceae bacterium]|nr:YdeI/OmpD-associated family protein [Pyrinomonadaceae bacterium]
MSKINNFQDFHPRSRSEWREWLTENHAKLTGIWFVYFKKHTGKPRVTYDEAVEEALCFGWIDSLPRKFDGERSKLLFTTRKPKSVWSKPNKLRVEKLIREGLMTEGGLAKIEAAKRNGSWNALDASDNLEIPKDLAKAFEVNKTAEQNFTAFSDSVKRGILYWIMSAKRDETRAMRIEKTISMAKRNKRANFDKD